MGLGLVGFKPAQGGPKDEEGYYVSKSVNILDVEYERIYTYEHINDLSYRVCQF